MAPLLEVQKVAVRKPAPPRLVDSRDQTPSLTNQVTKDAAEFGSHFKQGGWRLGLLVARSVEQGTGGSRDNRSHVNSSAKVSMRQFAEMSGVSLTNVSYYYRAWELAADDGRCTKAKELIPGQDDLEDQYDEDDEELRSDWSKYLKQARVAKKPVSQKDSASSVSSTATPAGETGLASVIKLNPPSAEPDSEPDSVTSSPIETESKDEVIQLDSLGSEDEDEEPPLTRSEILQADSAIQRTELLEMLESARSLFSKVSRLTTIVDGNGSILSQIGSIAADINTIAKALSTQSN